MWIRKLTGWMVLLLLLLIALHDHFVFGNLHRHLHPKYYASPYFTVSEVNRDDAQRGEQHARRSRIVFCGLCRDIESHVSKNLSFLELLGAHFQDYRIVLFENDSKDRTHSLIAERAVQNPHIKLLSETFGDQTMYSYGPLSQRRIDKMAFFRNQYMRYIQENLSDFDYVMMIDMDVEGYFNLDGWWEVLAHSDQWDAVFCNGRTSCPGTFGTVDVMYDGFAYLSERASYQDCQSEKGASVAVHIRNLLEMQFLSEKWTRVKSAFNGAGLYQMALIRSTHFPRQYTCEWIGFHHMCAEQGYDRILIARDWQLHVGIQGDPLRINYFL